MKILIVEDKEALADVVATRLKKEGLKVDVTNDGNNGYFLASSDYYDLIVLDVMLPGMDGFEILKNLNKDNINSKIIMLTAKTTISDKLKGLNGGAVDYITKPFHLDELIARINIALGKQFQKNQELLTYKDIELDTSKSILRCASNNKEVELVKKELEILQYFLNNSQQILSKNQIYNKIWGIYNEIESNNLEVYFSFIRRKLKAIDSKVNIRAFRGLGYKLEYKDE